MDQKFVAENIYYLNISELKSLCELLRCPYEIFLRIDNKYSTTGSCDRKKILIKRIIDVLNGKKVHKTVYKESVIKLNSVKVRFNKNDLVRYGEYKNGNQNILKLLKTLTDGKFKFGALSCELADKYWRQGIAPSFQEFAKKYMIELGKDPHPEWKYIDFIRKGGTIKEWKKKRNNVSKKIINMITKFVKHK